MKAYDKAEPQQHSANSGPKHSHFWSENVMFKDLDHAKAKSTITMTMIERYFCQTTKQH